MTAVMLIPVRCEGQRPDGRPCGRTLGFIQEGAAYSLTCKRCKAKEKDTNET